MIMEKLDSFLEQKCLHNHPMLYSKINSKNIKGLNGVKGHTTDSNQPRKWKWLLIWFLDDETSLSIKAMEEIVKEMVLIGVRENKISEYQKSQK